jgi:hypothetical protein
VEVTQYLRSRGFHVSYKMYGKAGCLGVAPPKFLGETIGLDVLVLC